jgi:hypothetical protein
VRTHVGMYRIEETLGRGGMGVVYRGLHERLNRTVAIKALAPELTQQPEFKDRFFSEARTQARLQHPNIVAVYDLLEEGGEFFIVMEFVAGTPLDAILRRTAGQGMDLAQAVNVISQVLAALDYAHSEAVIHRDVKPSNVLVTAGGRVKLMDFGIALLVGDKRLTSSQATVGTPIYMSPEQILRPRQMDHRTDIYSAAIMLYEMLAGVPPFDAETHYEINKLQIEAPAPDLCERRPHVPSAVSQAIQCALAKNPDDRFVSAGEMLRALQSAVPGALPAQTGQSAWTPAQALVPTEEMGALRPATSPGASQTPIGTAAALATAGAAAGTAPFLLRAAKPRRPALIAVAAGIVALLAAAIFFGISLRKPAPAPASPDTGSVAPAVSRVTPPASTSSMPEQAQSPDAPPSSPSPAKAATSPARLDRQPGTLATGLTRRPASDAAGPGNQRLSAVMHRKEVARIREALQSGMTKVKDEIDSKQYAAARERVAGLQALAASDQSDLVDEIVSLRLLDKEITSRELLDKTERVDQAAWQRRLAEIQELVGGGKFPEAKQLAVRLAADPSAPPEIVAQAHDLASQADQGLKNVWGKAKPSNVINQIEKKAQPPPPR